MGEVRITLKGKKPPPPEPKRGQILPTDIVPYLPRHRGGIRFYDMGSTWNGAEWVTNSFEVNNPLVFTPGTPGSNDWTLSPNPVIALSDVRTLEADILSVDPPDFTSTYRQITRSRDISFDIRIQGVDSEANIFSHYMPSAGTNWKENSLTLEREELDSSQLIIVDGFPDILNQVDIQFCPLELHDRSASKVTTTPDYSAPGVDFQLTNNAQIFLMPFLCNNRGESETAVYDDPPGPEPLYLHFVGLNAIWRLRPRTDDIDQRYNASPLNPPEVFDMALANTLAAGASRTFTVLHSYLDASPNTHSAGGTFPIPGDSSTVIWPAVGFYSAPVLFNNASMFTGQLSGIVRQGGVTYYFWYLTGL